MGRWAMEALRQGGPDDVVLALYPAQGQAGDDKRRPSSTGRVHGSISVASLGTTRQYINVPGDFAKALSGLWYYHRSQTIGDMPASSSIAR